jgi:hypothetical protein
MNRLMPPAPAGLQLSAVTLHALVGFLRNDGLYEEVLARVSDPTRAVLAALPPRAGLVSAAVLGDALQAMSCLGGRDLFRRYGAWSTRNVVGPLVKPLIDTALALSGRSPTSVLAHLDQILGLIIQSTQSRWEPRGERSGTFSVIYTAYEPAPATFVIWQGSLGVYVERGGGSGTVGDPVIAADGRSASYPITWEG